MSVVVPVWNRRDLLERFLCTLRLQTFPIGEVLVVDDGSSDGSADLAESLGARAIRMQTHGGFAKAVNRGIREARSPLIAVVNNDVEMDPEWLAELAKAMEEGVWFATGKILQPGSPERIDVTYDAICRGGTAWRVGNGRPDGPLFREPRIIGWVPFTAALFRAELFDNIGLLDERFESYLEDVDFGLRCALAGFRGRYVPSATARHLGSATLGRWHTEVTRRISRNQVFLVAKHYPRRLFFRYLWPILVAQSLWGMVALRHGAGWAWLRGKAEGLRRLSDFRNGSQSADVGTILSDSEHEIRRLQKASGSDYYWSLYFLLTSGGAK
ncbi:MAG: glycosyltransferase family 2 protein [Bryobacteraceae bacterium]